MENREELARRVLCNREFFAEVRRCFVQIGVTFDQLGQHCIENTYHKYIVFQNEENRIFSKRGHGRIGRQPFIDILGCAEHNGIEQFKQFIDTEAQNRNFYQVNVQYVNAKHLVWGQPDSDLSETVNNLLLRLFDEYMPIGILHIDQVLEAEDLLYDIRERLENDVEIDIASSERFYQIIPQNEYAERFEIINNRRIYRNKIEYLNQLRSALEAISASVRSTMNPIDYLARYWLRTELYEITRTSVEFSQLDQCFQATQHPNDMYFRLTNVFKVASSADIEFVNDMPNQCLLYHFVFPCKILGILRDGLQIAPNHFDSQTRSLGDGIYFWDCASLVLSEFFKLQEKSPVLLVCRVARGVVHNVNPSNALPLPNGINSFFCEGKEFSNVTSKTENVGNVEMYCEQIAPLYGIVNSDNYNMYMVQNKHQVKIEYILQFQKT